MTKVSGCLARLAAVVLLALGLCLPMASQPAPRELARAQGKAENALLDWVLLNSGPLKGDIRAAQFRVAYTITPAEGWWQKAAGGTLEWHEPPEESFHLRVFVADADGRLLSTVRLHALLIDADGNQQAAPVIFGWYPLINAYGANVPLDSPGGLRLHVVVEAQRATPDEIVDFPSVDVTEESLSHIPLATAVIPATEAELLKPYNDALSAAITAMWKRSSAGEERADGDYFIGYAIAPVDGAEERLKRGLKLGHDNWGLSLLVRDSRTGRLIPELHPQVSFAEQDGKRATVEAFETAERSGMQVYLADSRIRQHGAALRVHFDAPAFRRWGRQSERFARAGEVEFPAAKEAAKVKERK